MALGMLISMFASLVASSKDPLVIQQSINGLAPLAPAPFCNGIACPAFQLLNKTEEYEVRMYPKSSWVSTELKGVDYNKATRPMFMTLFSYIQGANVQKKKIPMTCPVLNRIIPGAGATCESDFIMSFYNDPKEGTPAAPTSKTVYINEMEMMVVYVKSFGGFADYEDYRDNALKLGKALDKDGLGGTYITEHYFTAGYDSPFKLFYRHNEVWFMKTQ